MSRSWLWGRWLWELVSENGSPEDGRNKISFSPDKAYSRYQWTICRFSLITFINYTLPPCVKVLAMSSVTCACSWKNMHVLENSDAYISHTQASPFPWSLLSLLTNVFHWSEYLYFYSFILFLQFQIGNVQRVVLQKGPFLLARSPLFRPYTYQWSS